MQLADIVGDGFKSRARLVAAVALSLFAFALPSRAHDPITTKVRFNKEVVRILQKNCLGCHHPDGIAFSLATYDEARPWAKAIKEEVLEKRMPPWRAMKGYGEFRNAPSLTQRDIDMLVNWVEGGAPRGDEKDLPPGPLFSDDWQLGKPDLILRPESESQIAGDADEIRNFVIPIKLKEDRWLTAVDLLPGNASVVHCAAIYLLPGDAGMPPASMVQADKDDLRPPIVPEDLRSAWALATWMPGQKTVALDGGVAQMLAAGSRVVVSIHYRGAGEPAKDISSVGLYFSKSHPVKQIHELTVTCDDSVIPAGRLDQRKMSFTLKSDSEAIGIRPSVHPILASVQATAFRPDGSQEVLMWTRGYQFDWKPTYLLKHPVALPKGTRVEVIVYFDNSDDNPKNPNTPAKPVRWSELGSDPSCVFLLADSIQ